MAWEWSHAPEAYEIAENNLRKKSTKWLAECYAEWKCYHVDEGVDPFSDGRYTSILREAGLLDKHVLVEYIWHEAVAFRTCDNGGGALWMCPFGCHKVKC